MVELGRRQAEENRVVRGCCRTGGHRPGGGRPHQPARPGCWILRPQAATVHLVANREEAVAWVRANLSPGDAVLYENDLPDHYP